MAQETGVQVELPMTMMLTITTQAVLQQDEQQQDKRLQNMNQLKQRKSSVLNAAKSLFLNGP